MYQQERWIIRRYVSYRSRIAEAFGVKARGRSHKGGDPLQPRRSVDLRRIGHRIQGDYALNLRALLLHRVWVVWCALSVKSTQHAHQMASGRRAECTDSIFVDAVASCILANIANSALRVIHRVWKMEARCRAMSYHEQRVTGGTQLWHIEREFFRL